MVRLGLYRYQIQTFIFRNFDFDREIPLEGRLVWEKVNMSERQGSDRNESVVLFTSLESEDKDQIISNNEPGEEVQTILTISKCQRYARQPSQPA